MMAGFGTYIYFAATLPTLPDIATYHEVAATTTVMRAADGTPLAELANERREILPFDKFPPQLVHAFLAAEDRRFYEHQGIDYRGIGRALTANLRAGATTQGGSTITQQVAKSFLTAERTLQRKVREAILARRLERHFSKREILTLYLNQIFLGHGSYGVAAAARRYFDKAVGDLDLGEMALLAGLARAPSRFSPLTNLEAARARRDQVLGTMVAAGYLTEDEANHWRARPVVVRQRPDFFRTTSPYFAEHVRRDVVRRYGEKKLLEGGLDIETAVVPWIDAVRAGERRLLAAQAGQAAGLARTGRAARRRGGRRVPRPHRRPLRRRSARRGAAVPGHRRGRGGGGRVPRARRQGDLHAAARRDDVGGAVQRQGRRATASCWSRRSACCTPATSSGCGTRTSRSGGGSPTGPTTPRARCSGCPPTTRPRPARDRRSGAGPAKPVELLLEQTPRVQGTLFSYDHDTGYVVAMVGGDDYDRSEFNRVSQACRQPGSAYKPMYYSLALDRGYGFTSLLNDVPRAEVDPITGEVWTPTNLNNTVEYQVTMEYALIWSKNVPSVQLFKLVGGKEVEKWARRLGITTPIIPDQALALGASCTRIDELTRAFSAFAKNGVIVDPVYIRRIRDRNGVAIEDHSAPGDPFGTPAERLDRLVALAAEPPPEPVIPPRTASLTSTLLRHVVTRGHAPAIRSTGLPAAGKTGTSSATMDTWFIGYTSRWMTSAWMGDDLRERPLGTEGRGVHADRADVRALHDRGGDRPAAAGHPVGAAAGREGRRHGRQAAHDDGGGRGRRAPTPPPPKKPLVKPGWVDPFAQ